MTTRNKFPGRCNRTGCPQNRYNGVGTGEGYITRENGRWVTWCRDCVPEQKTTVPADTRRELTAGGRIYTPYEPANLPLIKSLRGPGGFGPRWNADGKFWEVSTDQADRARLLEVASRLNLVVAPELREVAVTAQAATASHAGLYPFQVEGVNWMAQGTKRLLADEMGLGKTIQALISIPQGGKALVVCPATLKLNWRNEAVKWRPDLTPVVLSGNGSFRFPTAGEIVITNYDILADYLDPTPKVKGQKKAPKMAWEQLKAWRETTKAQHPEAAGTVVIFDEAHKAKNYKTERSRKVRELARLASNVWGLTGTPLDNRPSDLYGVLDSLDMAFDVFSPRKGQSPFRRFQELFNASTDRWGGVTYGTPDPIVPELLRRIMLRRRRNEVMPDLPRKTYTTLTVNGIAERTRKQMDEMWEADGTALEVSGGLPSFEEFSAIRAALAKGNIPAMLEYIEDQEEQGTPLVVFSAHLAPLDALKDREGWGVISGETSLEKRQQIVDDFQAGKLKGVALTIRAGGVGLTLTHAWKVLFVDLDWVPGWNSQAEDRVCRIGQTYGKVEIVRMVNDHPLTLHVLEMLAQKIAMIEAAIERGLTATPATVPVAGETETAEQFQARMDAIQKAQEELEAVKAETDKAKAKSKMGLIHGREKARNSRPLLPLTENRIAVVREAFGFMLSVCDGAREKDGQGFNKPDAIVAHWILTAGLETTEEVESAYYMLVRYHRQLSGNYPSLFED